MTLEQFHETYPQQTKKINGKDFVYRYYKNKNALLTSTDYTNYKNSSSFKGGSLTSSGFGSGLKSYGG